MKKSDLEKLAKTQPIEDDDLEFLDTPLSELPLDEGEKLVVDVSEKPVHDIKDAFVWEVLEGTDEFKRYISQYLQEHVTLVFEDTNLGYYDWNFTQHLIDAYMEYSRSVLKDVSKGVDREDIKEFVDKLFGKDNLSWMDIYSLITEKNGSKGFGKFIMEKK